MATLLLAIFTTYFVNVTLFVHYHIVDGVTIVHSHFSTEEHQQNPTSDAHSENQLTLISVLSNFVAEFQEGLDTPLAKATEHHPIFVDVEITLSESDSYALPQLRAPPVKSIS